MFLHPVEVRTQLMTIRCGAGEMIRETFSHLSYFSRIVTMVRQLSLGSLQISRWCV